jgi:hypothetical protein
VRAFVGVCACVRSCVGVLCVFVCVFVSAMCACAVAAVPAPAKRRFLTISPADEHTTRLTP